MGGDSLLELGSWSRPQELLQLCTVVVFPRAGSPIRLDVPGPATIVVIEAPAIDVSSSQIRHRVRAGEPVDAMVAPGVLAYIREHALYSNP
jgi:nicotinate-nucleotide adenylyltransferase